MVAQLRKPWVRLGGLSVYLLFANFLWSMSAKNCENWLTFIKVMS